MKRITGSLLALLLMPAFSARAQTAAAARDWLEYEPEKVLFGTDAAPATPGASWEESAWMTDQTAREALAVALTELIKDGDTTRERASELARLLLRENAARLYGRQP